MQFSDLIGQEVGLIIPRFHPEKIQSVKVIGVESGGVWIESQWLTNQLLEKFGVASAPRTAAVFVPYHQIAWGVTSVSGPSLHEKAFGV